MKNLLKRILKGTIAVPAFTIRSCRRYQPLASVLSQPAPNILLVACHWIGDTLWASQVVPVLRNLPPDCHLACLTKPVCAPLWSGGLGVDRCIETALVVSDCRREPTDWPGLRRLGAELGTETWDLVIDLTGNRYSAILSHWIRAKHTLGFDGGEFGMLYATCVRDAERPGRHLSERPFRVIEPLAGGFKYPESMIPPRPEESYEAACRRHGLDPESPLAVIAPGAGWADKEWGDAHFAHLADRLNCEGYQIVLVESPAGRARLEGIARAMEEAGEASAILAEPGIDAALSLVSGCGVFVGNDSGLGHVAAAMGRLTVSVFTGATDPVLCRPLGRNAHVVQVGEPDDVWKAIQPSLRHTPGGGRQTAGCGIGEGERGTP